MGFFRNLDLYKVIILASIVLIPAALGFVYWVEGRLEVARIALRDAEKRNGEIERIGALQRKLESVNKTASHVALRGEDHSLFFEQMISTSSGGTLKSTDYEISPEQTQVVQALSAQDQQVKIDFRQDGKVMKLPRDFIHALVFNVESNGTQIWKLRQLTMQNAAIKGSPGGKREAPEKTVSDDWELSQLHFARREPMER